MSVVSWGFSRPETLDHADTILYEIEMLRFTRDCLLSPPATSSQDKKDKYVYLEGFLLHYRNLIEFFGKQKPGEGDLSIHHPEAVWPIRRPGGPDLEFMRVPDLWEKYDTYDNVGSISKYLHHCTEQRTEAKSWNVQEMFEELRPAIERFESLLPEYTLSGSKANRREIRADQTLDGHSTY